MTEKDIAVLKRVHDFLGILIREDLIKHAPFLDEEPELMVSDLADDLHDVIKTMQKPRRDGRAPHRASIEHCERKEH